MWLKPSFVLCYSCIVDVELRFSLLYHSCPHLPDLLNVLLAVQPCIPLVHVGHEEAPMVPSITEHHVPSLVRTGKTLNANLCRRPPCPQYTLSLC